MGKKMKEPEFDADLLVEVLSIQSYSKKDEEMMTWLKDKLKDMGLLYTLDEYGNVYVTKGKADLYPCLVSHTDTVHKILDDFGVFEAGDVLFAFSETEGTQVGIGGDDKVGMSICLNALQDLAVVKAVFFRNEEIGCLGSKQADMDFFKDCSVVLQADRRGHSDFINNAAGVQLSSKEFIDDIADILKAHHYLTARGSVTDVMALKQRGLEVCAANIGCGYWSPHSDKEIVVISDVEDCYDMIMDIFKLCEGRKYEHIHVDTYSGKDCGHSRGGGYRTALLPSEEGEASMANRDYTDEDRADQRQLLMEFVEAGKEIANLGEDDGAPWGGHAPQRQPVRHDTRPMVDLDDTYVEDAGSALEEIEIVISDLESNIADFRRAYETIKSKQGKL